MTAPSGDFVSEPQYFKVTDEDDITDLLIEIRSMAVFKGIVTDTDSQPIPGAEVFVPNDSLNTYSPILFEEAVRRRQGSVVITDSEGRFTCSSPADHSHLFVRKKGYTIGNSCGGSGDKSMVFRLAREAIITGTVANPDGSLAKNALIIANPSQYKTNYSAPIFFLVKTNEGGTFQINGLHGDKYKLNIQDKDKKYGTMLEREVEAEESTNAGTITLKPLIVVNGTVVDEEGKGIKGAKISLDYGSDFPWWIVNTVESIFPMDKVGRSRNIFTDLKGRFFIRDISEHYLTIKASHDEYSTEKVSFRTGEDTDLKIALSKINFAKVNAKVIDGRTGKPAPDALVAFVTESVGTTSPYGYRRDSYEQETNKKTDDKGIAYIRIRQPGKWTFAAAASGIMSDYQTINIEEGSEHEIELLLEPAPTAVIKLISKDTAQPVPEADIRISPSDKRFSSINRAVIQSQSDKYSEFESDENGIAKISVIPCGKYKIRVEAFGHEEKFENLNVTEGDNILTIELERTAVVKGKVVDPEGKPVSEAEVRIFPASTISYQHYYDFDESDTDDKGTFKLQVSKSGSYFIYASHREHAIGKSDEFRITGKETVDNVIITMTTGGTISGRIADVDGHPIEHVNVGYFSKSKIEQRRMRYLHYADPHSAQSDKDGVYQIKSISPGTYKVIVKPEKHLGAVQESITVEEGVDTPDVDFTLEKGLEVSGTVVDIRGNPIEDAEIKADPQDDEDSLIHGEREAKTESDGTFTVAGLKDCEYEITCTKGGFFGEKEEVNPPDTEIKFVLKKGGKIKGVVLSQSDQLPIRDFFVSIDIDYYDNSKKYSQIINREDLSREFKDKDDGSFEMPNMPAGEWSMTVFAEDCAPEKIEKVKIETEETTDIGKVFLRKGTLVNIHIVSETEETPIKEATVSIMNALDSKDYGRYYSRYRRRGQVVTDESGNCVLKGITPGKKIIMVSHANFVNQTVDLEIEDESEKYITVKLSEGMSFKGVVISKATNTPLPGADIGLDKPGGMSFSYYRARRDDNTTDENGIFTLKNLKPGKYAISINHEEHAPLTEDLIINEDTQSKAFYLTKGGSLLVRVKDTEGEPVVGCELMLMSKSSGYNESSTDENGECLFENLQKGAVSVVIEFMAEGGAVKAKRATIIEGKTAELEFILGGGYAVYGIITRDGNPIKDTDVLIGPPQMLVSIEGNAGFTSTDEDGEFRIEGLEPGKYVIIANPSRNTSKAEKVHIIDQDVEVNISISSGSVSGAVTDEDGNALEDVSVKIIPLSGDEEDPDSTVINSIMSDFRAFGDKNTDSEGKYSFDSIGEGEFRIYAKKDGYALAVRTVKKDEDEDLENVDFRLKSSIEITGKITAEDNTPLENAYILVINSSGKAIDIDETSMDGEGKYVLKGLSKGQFELVVAAKGYASQRKIITVAEENNQDIDFKLVKGKELSITVTDSNGEKVEGALATFADKDPLVANFLNMLSGDFDIYSMYPSSNTSDSNGKLTISNLASQKYTISISKTGYSTKEINVNITSRDETAEVILKEE